MNTDSINQLRSCTTRGEILRSGEVIDLVASSEHEGLDLILYEGAEPTVIPHYLYKNFIYRPAQMDLSVRRALRFPSGAAEYDRLLDLLSNISGLCGQYLTLPESACNLVACWVASTWVQEYFHSPPSLQLAGCSLSEGMEVFRFLQALCRRGIVVANLDNRLPLSLQPTLLTVASGHSKKVHHRWQTGNYHGVYVPGRKGTLEQLRCAKAIFSDGVDEFDCADESLRIVLLPKTCPAPEFTDADLDALAAELQSKLQLFRLRTLHSKSQSVRVHCPAELALSGLAREFFVVFGGEPEARKLLQPLIDQQLQATAAERERNPHAVIVEVLWGAAHEMSSISVTELAHRTNSLLYSRGERLEYSVNEVGWKVSDLGVPRPRTSKGKVVRFSRDTSQRIHELSKQFRLTLPKAATCPDCVPSQVVER